jgi:DNA-binding YbaB/EbfC family protein
MQKNMQQAQAELATIDVEGQAASGMVKVTMSCSHEVRRVSLDDSILSDKEMLEDLIVLALNDAVKNVAAITEQRMSGFGAGMGLPPGMKLPF